MACCDATILIEKSYRLTLFPARKIMVSYNFSAYPRGGDLKRLLNYAEVCFGWFLPGG